MKRFAIVLLVFAMVFTIMGCSDTMESEPAQTSAAPDTSTTESKECKEHDFSEATLLSPRTCSVCYDIEGEPLYTQCKTWEDVVGCLYFGEYTYELRVKQSGNNCLLFLEFNDASQFATEESVKNFMAGSLMALMEVSGLVRGKHLTTTIDTPACFRVDVAVSLIVPGGTIVCTPTDNNMVGVYTVLAMDDESEHAALLESVYKSTFGSLGITIG